MVGNTATKMQVTEKMDSLEVGACPPQPGGPNPPTPDPNPGKPCTAVMGWPKFDSQGDLNASPWAKYFSTVYGAVPSTGYPICLSDFGMLYTSAMSAAGVSAPTEALSHGGVPTCPSAKSKGLAFSHEITYPSLMSGALYILQPPPYTASDFPENGWVEVMHGVGAGVGRDENVGAWFYYLKGTGIWFNLGKTKSFQEHQDAYDHFGVRVFNMGGLTEDESLSKAAAHSGYDSIVFLNHRHDIGTCPECCHRLGLGLMLVEIIGAKLVGSYSCAGPGGNAVKSGWQGSNTCKCKDCKDCFINCEGLPQAGCPLFERNSMTLSNSTIIV
jgi:hypothetical protein